VRLCRPGGHGVCGTSGLSLVGGSGQAGAVLSHCPHRSTVFTVAQPGGRQGRTPPASWAWVPSPPVTPSPKSKVWQHATLLEDCGEKGHWGGGREGMGPIWPQSAGVPYWLMGQDQQKEGREPASWCGVLAALLCASLTDLNGRYAPLNMCLSRGHCATVRRIHEDEGPDKFCLWYLFRYSAGGMETVRYPCGCVFVSPVL
jgi:hypothetical protein